LKSPFKQITYRPNALEGLMGIAWLSDRSILYTAEIGGVNDFWKLRLDDGSSKQITFDSGNNIYPQVCGNGRFFCLHVG
jgi:hypothetical protein